MGNGGGAMRKDNTFSHTGSCRSAGGGKLGNPKKGASCSQPCLKGGGKTAQGPKEKFAGSQTFTDLGKNRT